MIKNNQEKKWQGLQKFKGKPLPTEIETSSKNIESQGLQEFQGNLQGEISEAKASRDPGESSGEHRARQGLQEIQGKPQGKILEAKASRSSRGSLRDFLGKPRPQGVPGEASQKTPRRSSREPREELKGRPPEQTKSLASLYQSKHFSRLLNLKWRGGGCEPCVQAFLHSSGDANFAS